MIVINMGIVWTSQFTDVGSEFHLPSLQVLLCVYYFIFIFNLQFFFFIVGCLAENEAQGPLNRCIPQLYLYCYQIKVRRSVTSMPRHTTDLLPVMRRTLPILETTHHTYSVVVGRVGIPLSPRCVCVTRSPPAAI